MPFHVLKRSAFQTVFPSRGSVSSSRRTSVRRGVARLSPSAVHDSGRGLWGSPGPLVAGAVEIARGVLAHAPEEA